MIENLDKIKAAIEIETKYRYIDIHGKTQKFSSFIKQEAQKNYKKSSILLAGLQFFAGKFKTLLCSNIVPDLGFFRRGLS